MSKHILIADDDPAIIAALNVLLLGNGYQTSSANTVEEALFLIKKQRFDLVLLDMNYELDTTSGQEGLSAIKQIKDLVAELPIVVMTGWGSVELCVESLQLGAGDFIEKPWDNERLVSVVRNQIALADSNQRAEQLNIENQLLKEKIKSESNLFIAEDSASKSLLQTIEQVSNSDISVMLLGENGTGKSMLAEQVHQLSSRREHPFVSVNMGAIPEQLFESEMFGHVKGAFTDAKQDRIGRFELANGGTLFLDEVANIPTSQQAKLLRVLESSEFERVGSSKTQLTDVRIICATNADLNQLCEQGKFRSDLMYRITGIELTVPPLRERKADIVPLAQQFVSHFAKKYRKSHLQLADDAISALMHHDWSGNVRELNHCIERATILSNGEQIEAQHLHLNGSETGKKDNVVLLPESDSELTLDELEHRIITERLNKYGGNAIDAAKSLGLSRSAFYRRLDKYQIMQK